MIATSFDQKKTSEPAEEGCTKEIKQKGKKIVGFSITIDSLTQFPKHYFIGFSVLPEIEPGFGEKRSLVLINIRVLMIKKIHILLITS